MSLRSVYFTHILLLAVYFGVSVAVMPHLSETIPMHFDFSGQPTRWAPTTPLAWLSLPLVSAATAAFLYGLMRLARRVPHLWNISEKQTFLDLPPSHRAAIQDRMEVSMGIISILTTLLMATFSIGGYEVAVGRAEQLPAYTQLSFAAWFVLVIWLAIRTSTRAGRDIRKTAEAIRADGESPTSRSDSPR